MVGAGPAGLTCAYQLAQKDYAVTVFEALPVAGGMLAVGIPEYRLPRDMLAYEIDGIRRLGVEIMTDRALGRDFTLDDLFRQGYRAVFLGIGAHRGRKLKLPGAELPGVQDGLTFLREIALADSEGIQPPARAARLGRVAVIGGGKTAVDAARSALRLGAEGATIFYRRTRAEMPVGSRELDEAEAEGVQIECLTVPARFVGEARIGAMVCLRTALGEPDESGRGRPAPIPGSEFTVEADTVIVAIGRLPDTSVIGGVALTSQGAVAADPETCETSQPGVFAGGDAVGSGPATVIDAVAAGNRGAESIDRYLKGLDLRSGRVFRIPEEQIARKTVGEELRVSPRAEMPTRPLGERAGSFAEIELGYDAAQARREAERCLDCAVCSECLACVSACGPDAIDHRMQAEKFDLEVGTIILATGHRFFDPARLPQYGYGRLANILDSMEFERMCNASGPTGGEILTTDGRMPENIVFIHCVGSRDPGALPYCSRVCCMHAMKQAHLARERTGAAVYELYSDICAPGKGYEEFYQQVQQEGVIFVRGRAAEVIPLAGRLVVKAEDPSQGCPITLPADLVVLVTGMEPHVDSERVAQTFHVTRDKDGFFLEAHPKLRPFNTNTDGIFLAGTCQAPRDIPDTVAHASAAAAGAMSLMGRGAVVIEPGSAEIDADLCGGCRICNNLCAYAAISFDPVRGVSEINPALCKGCGVCIAACPAGAVQSRYDSDRQIFAEIEGLLVAG